MAERQHPRTTHSRRLAGTGHTRTTGEPTPESTTRANTGPDARGTSPDHIPPSTPPEPVPQEPAPPRPPRRRRSTTDDSPTLTVIVQPRDFRLPNVLRHIEEGKIVLVIPEHNDPD
ncbi:hypothetical protein GCM10009687_06800 [Asanoa iriomotensis]